MRRMEASTSTPISVTQPWQKSMALLSLGASAKMRSYCSRVETMRAAPPIGSGIGGSSGCRAMRTPHSSATGRMRSRNQAMFSHIPSSSICLSRNLGPHSGSVRCHSS